MKSVLALYLMAWVAYAQTTEPEPEMYSTTMEPEPESTMGMTSPATSAPSTAAPTSPAATSTAAPMSNGTTTPPPPKHTITIAATLSNISAYSTLSDLTNQLVNSLAGSVSEGSQVEVKVKALNIKVVYGGMPDPLPDTMVDHIAMATKKMYLPTVVALSAIKVNNKTHSSQARRLNSGTAEVITRVENTGAGGDDIVSKVKDLQSKTSATAFTEKLQEEAVASGSTYDLSNITGGEPEIKIEAETIITGQNTAPTTSDLTSGLSSIVDDIEVTSVSSENSVTTGAPSADNPLDDHAAIAPMLTIWAALYAFVMS